MLCGNYHVGKLPGEADMCPATVRSFSWIHPNQNSEPYSCGPGLLPDNYRTRT